MTTDARPALVGNAGDEEQVEKAARRVRVRAHSATQDLAYLLTVPQFLRFLKRTLDFVDPYKTPFDDVSGRRTTLNIGRQEVGRWLVKQLEDVAPDAYPKAMIAVAQQELP